MSVFNHSRVVYDQEIDKLKTSMAILEEKEILKVRVFKWNLCW